MAGDTSVTEDSLIPANIQPSLSSPVPVVHLCFAFRDVPHSCCAPAGLRGLCVGRCGYTRRGEGSTLEGSALCSNPITGTNFLAAPFSSVSLPLIPCEFHELPQDCSSASGGQRLKEQGGSQGRSLFSPASHQDCFVGSELLPVHDDDNISQDVPASKAVEIEEDVAGVARELDAAVCRRGHLESGRHKHQRKMRMDNNQASTLNLGKRQLLLWDMLRWPTAPGRGSTSSLVPRQTALHHTTLLPGCLVRSLVS